MTGYSRRGIALLTGGGAAVVALLMMMSPASAAASANLLHAAPYHGAVSPSNGLSQTGCGKVAIAKHWNFKMKTGLGGGIESGKATACKTQQGGIGQNSYVSANGGFTLGVAISKVPKGTNNITENMIAKYSVAITAADGFASTVTSPTCTNAATIYSSDDIEYEWNGVLYTYTYGNYTYNYTSFSQYNYTDTYNGGSYHYGTGPIPSPFNYNNTTGFFHDTSYQYSAACSAYSYGEVYTLNYLKDNNNGTTISPTGSNFGTPLSYYPEESVLFNAEVEVYNQTSWYCYNDIEWLGAGYGSNSSAVGQGAWHNYSACYSYNTTLTSILYNYVPTFSSTTGTNNTLTDSSTNTASGSVWWDYTFNNHHSYTLVSEVYSYFDSSNSWQHGYASFGLNMASNGNGYKLASISLT